jgi:DNA-binding NarL/FixJ family response regulator
MPATLNPAVALSLAERDTEIMRLRRAGVPAQDIALQFGLTPARISQIWHRSLKQLPMEEAELLRKEQVARLDALSASAHEILTRNLKQDDPVALAAIAAILRIEERRAKLLGLDMPTRVEATIEAIRYEVVGVDPALSA